MSAYTRNRMPSREDGCATSATPPPSQCPRARPAVGPVCIFTDLLDLRGEGRRGSCRSSRREPRTLQSCRGSGPTRATLLTAATSVGVGLQSRRAPQPPRPGMMEDVGKLAMKRLCVDTATEARAQACVRRSEDIASDLRCVLGNCSGKRQSKVSPDGVKPKTRHLHSAHIQEHPVRFQQVPSRQGREDANQLLYRSKFGHFYFFFPF